MWLRTRCQLDFSVSVPTPFIFMLRPRSGDQQRVINDIYRVEPHLPIEEYADMYGNLCQRILAPKGSFRIHTSAEVKTAEQLDKAPGAPFIDVQELPHHTLQFLLPSRFCESDRFTDMATSITKGQRLGYDQVKSIEIWLRRNVEYKPGTCDTALTAIDVNGLRNGVCRDLAHLGIALCRSLSIPARLVVGYLHNLKPMDLHAWFEAYVGGRWYAFDATQNNLGGGYVAIGYGRDAADVAIFNQYGPLLEHSNQIVQVERIEK